MAVLRHVFAVLAAAYVDIAVTQDTYTIEDASSECTETTSAAYSVEMLAYCCGKLPGKIEGCPGAPGATLTEGKITKHEGPQVDQCGELSAVGYSPEMRLRCCSRHTSRIQGCIQWDVASCCMGVLVVLFAVCCVVVFAMNLSCDLLTLWENLCLFTPRSSIMLVPESELREYIAEIPALNRKDAHDEIFGKRVFSMLRAQALLNRLMILAGFLTVVLTGHSSISPAITAAAVVPTIVRSRYIEVSMVHSGYFGHDEVSSKDIEHMFWGTLENYDDYSDGAVIGSMLLLDHILHPRFVGSFLYSQWGCVRALAPIMDLLHMWGLALLWLLLGQGAQWSCVRRGPHGYFVDPSSLEMVGWNLLADRAVAVKGSLGGGTAPMPGEVQVQRNSKALALGASRVLLENCPSGLISSSVLMFAGVESILDQPIAFGSALLSAAALCKKSYDFVKMEGARLEDISEHLEIAEIEITNVGQRVYGLALGILTGLVAIWILAKLYYIQACPHHAWELTAGCMQLE